MSATKSLAPRLATRPTLDRAGLARGYRPTALMARLSMRTAHLEALERYCQPAERKPACLYDARREEGRPLPFERMHNLLVQSAEEGWGTEEALVTLLSDWYAIYAPLLAKRAPDDVSFLGAAREKSEAVAAIHRAEMVPTPENRADAARELMQDVVVSSAYAKRLSQGAA
jgi:hypothetical protein